MESNKAIIFKNYSPLLLRGTPYQVTFGPYGIVQLAKSSKTGQVVAIKKLTCKVSQKQINFLKKIRHPNIIQLIDCYFQTKSQHTFLIFEYFQGRTLLQYIKLCYFKERDTTNKILLQLTQAISYLHSYSRYNLSVKPENVLLDSKNQAKFCFINIPLTQAPSIKPSRNLEYMSPEIFYDKKITDKNDIWSLGVLFYQIAEGVTPFSDFNAIQALGSFQKLSFSKKTKIQWIKMISQMLNPIAKQRPDLKDIIKKLEQTTNGGKSCEASKIQSDTSQIIQNKIKLVQINQLPQTSTKNLNSKRLTQVSQNNQSYFTKREQKCHHSYSIQGQQKISLKRFMTVQ